MTLDKLRSIEHGTLVHMDLCGPLATTSFGGANYFMLVKDDANSYMFIYFLVHNLEAQFRFKFVEKRSFEI